MVLNFDPIFQEDYEDDKRSWTTKVIDFCKSCIDPTRPIGEDASSEGYATPRSLETPLQIASKCSSLNQIRDPYASKHPASLRISEEEKRQRVAKFAKNIGANHAPLLGTTEKGLQASGSQDGSGGGGPANGNESIYTILIKLPPPSKLSVAEKTAGNTLNSNR